MATVHAYTPDGIYYECAANGKKYTGEEWHTYCAANIPDRGRGNSSSFAEVQKEGRIKAENRQCDTKSNIRPKMQAINIILILLTCKLSENCLSL